MMGSDWDHFIAWNRYVAAVQRGAYTPGFHLRRFETFACGGYTRKVAVFGFEPFVDVLMGDNDYRSGVDATVLRNLDIATEFVLVPGRTFRLVGDSLGSPEEVVTVEPFLLQRTPCPEAIWFAGLAEAGLGCEIAGTGLPYGSFAPGAAGRLAHGDRPVCDIAWNDCWSWLGVLNAAFATLLRVPNEAEWESACLPTDTRHFDVVASSKPPVDDSYYDAFPTPWDLFPAWEDNESQPPEAMYEMVFGTTWWDGPYPDLDDPHEESDPSGPQALDDRHPNALGVYDMFGNVSEFCWEWAVGENPLEDQGVARGGSYDDWIDDTGLGFRQTGRTDLPLNAVGVRFACSVI